MTHRYTGNPDSSKKTPAGTDVYRSITTVREIFDGYTSEMKVSDSKTDQKLKILADSFIQHVIVFIDPTPGLFHSIGNIVNQKFQWRVDPEIEGDIYPDRDKAPFVEELKGMTNREDSALHVLATMECIRRHKGAQRVYLYGDPRHVYISLLK